MESQIKKQELIKKSQQQPLTQIQQNSLDLSRNIVEGNTNISMFELGLKIEDTFSKATTRSVFKNELAQVGFSVVNVLVIRFMNSFGFSTKLTDDQLESLTVDTLDNFGYESLEDIILFFKMARTGKFGETNRGVDSNLIFGKWFPMYLDKKAELRERKHNDFKQESKNHNTISMKCVEISYREAMLRRLRENNKEFIINYTKSMDRQMLEDTIISWDNDDKLKNHVTMLKLQRRVIKS